MGNQAQKSVPNVEDSSDKSKEVATSSYEPHPQFLQDDAHASPHAITNKGATWIMENVESVTRNTKVRDWRSTSNSAFQHMGQQKGSSNNVSNGCSPTSSSDNVTEVGGHARPGTVSVTQNAISNKGDTKKDSGDVVSISSRKKILRAFINPESDINKGMKGPFRSLANQSLNLNYSEPNLLARAHMDNSDTFPVYTRCMKVSLTESNSEDSMSPEPRKNSIGDQSVSSEYATPAEDMSEITSPLDWSPNQDFMKLCWPSRESREESNSLQRKASETLIKVAGEISMLQREIQEAVSEKEQIRPPAEEPRFLRSASDSLRTRYKGSNTSNSSEILKTPELETRWIELAKGWQLRLKSIEGATDSGLKDLESCTLSQDKQQKTRFSWDQDVGATKKENGTVDKKQYEMEVKRLQGLLSQQEEKTSTLEIMKNREIQDLRREESRLKMEVVLKESEIKALWEKMSSLQEAFEQANRKCQAQEDRVLSLDKELEQFRKQHRAEKEKVVSLEDTLRQKCKDLKAETDKVAALEQSLQQKLKEHRVEMQRTLTLEQALEHERRDHRIEKERAKSLEMALEQVRSEQRSHAEIASSLKKTLEQTDSVQQVRTERVVSLEKELEETQNALQAQRERASSLENLLSQLRNELKMQTERIAYLQKEESLKLDKETALRHTHDLVRQLESEKAETQKKLQDLQEKMHADAEEWRQFQADLQTAVAVADDFKMEAEEQLHAAREKLRDVEKENERLKAEVVQMKGFVTVDHGSHREKKEEAVNSLIDPPTVNGITRLRKALPAGSMNSSTQLNQVSTETSGIFRTSNLLNKATRVTFQTAENDSSLARNEDRRNQLRNSVVQEVTSNDILKTREKGQDKPGSQVRRYAGSRRNALLQWCQSRTVGYKNIEVTNFSVCWSDGMAFCALLHSYLPDRIPFNELVPTQKKQNLKLAFDTANSVGIPQTLTVEEMLDRDGPDWQSVLLYVESIYQHFEQ